MDHFLPFGPDLRPIRYVFEPFCPVLGSFYRGTRDFLGSPTGVMMPILGLLGRSGQVFGGLFLGLLGLPTMVQRPIWGFYVKKIDINIIF